MNNTEGPYVLLQERSGEYLNRIHNVPVKLLKEFIRGNIDGCDIEDFDDMMRVIVYEWLCNLEGNICETN